MARNRREAPASKDQANMRSKIDKLRTLRLEDVAARQAAGIWGEISVWDIKHQPTGDVFVQLWKGRSAPDLLKLPAKRVAAKWAIEHQQLAEWLMRHKLAGFEPVLVAWDLSEPEARRVQQARIAEHRAGGRGVANPRPATASS